MKNTEANLYVVYDGSALKNNEMDIRELAPALLAISDVFEETNRILNKKDTEISVKVKASFEQGSFGIDLAIAQNFQIFSNFIPDSDNIFEIATIMSMLGFNVKDGVKGLVHVIKRLKNRKIKKTEIKKNSAKIITEDNDYIENIEPKTVELLNNPKIRKSLEQAIAKPLKSEGIESFACTNSIDKNKADFFIIKKSEGNYFIFQEEEKIINEERRRAILKIVSISFVEKYKWRFKEEKDIFYAEIQDNDFIQKIKNRKVSFKEGDLLKVNFYICQKQMNNNQIKKEYYIEKVINHQASFSQLNLFAK
ncbi:MAG: hypothetical protein JRJ49_00760 [Deltaproteobacteria bacterium]|nr:hypothetical protein [Deltaproteobacteria bacterium]